MSSCIDNSLQFLVYKSNSLLRNKLNQALKSFDITVEQWVTLKKLNQKEGYNQKELSKDTFKEQAVITRMLDILEQKSLVERGKSPNDRREFIISITDKGRKLLEEIKPNIIGYQELLDSTLNGEEMLQLKELLSKLCNGLTF